MQKIKAISLILVGIVLALAFNQWLEPSVNLDKLVYEQPINSDVMIKGFRNNSANATSGFSYNFYIVGRDEEVGTPFLITNTSEIQFDSIDKTAFSVAVKGKVYQFHNQLWVRVEDKLIQLHMNFSASDGPN